MGRTVSMLCPHACLRAGLTCMYVVVPEPAPAICNADISSSHRSRMCTAADVLLTVPNKAPTKGGRYQFGAIEGQLGEPGAYMLQFQVSPSLPGRPPLQLCARIVVAAGPPHSFEIKVKRADVMSAHASAPEHQGTGPMTDD